MKWKNEKLFQKWDKLKVVRHVANAAIEVIRSNKDISDLSNSSFMPTNSSTSSILF